MAKMFYTTEEAAQKLGVNGDQLKALISENKLREFRDGARVMFKVDQVDKLSSDRKAGTASGTKAGSGGPIGLAESGVHDSHGSDVISLADSQISSPSKDDTVVTTGGASKAGSKGGSTVPGAQQVFKPGEVKSAETGAQTTIQSAIDDQLSLEGVGSGSGLLDLTRESDDTSLGAELLDEIYPGGDTKAESGIGSASGIFEQTNTGTGAAPATGSSSGLEHMVSSGAPAATEYVEFRDPSSGAFGGFALASVIISAVTILIALCFYNGFRPNWVGTITQSMTYVLIYGVALAIVAVIFGVIGFATSRGR